MEDKQQNKRIFETLFFLLFFYYDYVLCVLLEHKQDSVHNIISFVGFNCKYKAKRNSYNIHKLLYKPKKNKPTVYIQAKLPPVVQHMMTVVMALQVLQVKFTRILTFKFNF